MNDSPYFEQTKLMLSLIPRVAQENCFALKGGTAINFFLHDMPRLSVDIDLVYVPIEDRRTSLKNIGKALKRIANKISSDMPGTQTVPSYIAGSKDISKLTVKSPLGDVKIEPNLVIRGTIYPPEIKSISPNTGKMFELETSMQILSRAELYAGKACAALDRQHPRDIFDMKILLESEGFTNDIRKAFVVYLVSHDRPINELIDPHRKDIQHIFDNQFQGMTTEEVSYEQLLQTREQYIEQIKNDLTDAERRFLMSVKEGEPKWDLLSLPRIDKLPAIKWKLINIKKMDRRKHKVHLQRLKTKLEL